MSLTTNPNADNTKIITTEIRFLTSNGTATQLAVDGSTFMGAAQVIGTDLQVRIRQQTTSDYRFFYYAPALPGIGTCTVSCTGGTFTYAGTSIAEPTDKYIQPVPQLSNLLTSAAAWSRRDSTSNHLIDVGNSSLIFSRNNYTEPYLTMFSGANPVIAIYKNLALDSANFTVSGGSVSLLSSNFSAAGGSVSLSCPVTVNGALTVNEASLTVAGGSVSLSSPVTVNGNLTVNGSLTVNAAEGRNPFFFVAGRYNGSTQQVIADYGKVSFTVLRNGVGFYTVNFGTLNPRGNTYVAFCQCSKISQVWLRTSTYMQVITMDDASNLVEDNVDFFIIN